MSHKQLFETERDFYRRLLTIAIPVILQSVITTGVNLVDNIMLGQLTETALSASTQANQFIGLYSASPFCPSAYRRQAAPEIRQWRRG